MSGRRHHGREAGGADLDSGAMPEHDVVLTGLTLPAPPVDVIRATAPDGAATLFDVVDLPTPSPRR